MNDLARLVSFSFYASSGGFAQKYRIVDRDGNPWFAAKDACGILELKNPSKAIKGFPPGEVSTITTITTSYSGETRPIPHKLLIVSEQGLFRLILKSRKPVAQEFKEKLITEILPAYRKQGINRASLPKMMMKKQRYPERNFHE